MGEVVTSRFTIDSKDAELAVQRVDKLIGMMNMTVAESKKILSDLFVDQTGKVRDHNKTTKEGTEGLKAYRQEQRQQDYVIRQTTQSLTNMVFALGFLSQGQDKAGSTTRQVTKSLLVGVAAMQAVEFSFFGIGQAGERVGGTLGKLMTGLSKWGGPVAIAVGALASLVAWLNLTDEAAKKASEQGLESFTQRFTRLSKVAQADVIASLKQDIARLKKERDQYVSYPEEMATSSASYEDASTITDKKKYDAKAKELAFAEDLLEKAEAEAKQQDLTLRALRSADDALKGNYTTIQEINNGIAIRNQELQEGVDLLTREALTQEQIRQRVDERERLQHRLSRMLQSSSQDAAELAESERIAYERNKSMPGVYLAALRAQKDATTDAKVKAEIDQKILNILRDQADLERDREGKRRSSLKSQEEGLNELFKIEQSLIIENILEPRKREEAEQERIHNERLAQIDEAGAKSGELMEAERLRGEENIRYEKARKSIQDKYYVEGLRGIAEGFQAIDQGLTSLSVRSDSVLSRMIRMAQIAVAILRTLAQMKQPDADKTSGYLNIIGNVLGFLGLFDTGGWTGPGSRNQVAGLVHKDEIVFEQPIVQRYRNELLSLRKSLQMGLPIGAAMPASDNGSLATAVLVSEIRSLKQAIRSMPIQVSTHLHGTMEGQTFIRKEMPGYEQFRTNKQTDKS